MKPQFGLFVLTFYHILLRFSTKAAVNKPQQNRNSCHQNRNKPRILLPVRDILVPFGLGMVGERHCPSKARSNFDCVERCFLQQNSCASLCGQTFDRLRLTLPVLGCAERYGSTKIVPLPLGFCIGIIWVLSGNGTAPVPVIPCRKGVCYKQKIMEVPILKTAVIYARYSSDSQTEQSIEGQVRVCKQFAEKNDLLVVDQYIDRATTGMNDNRAAFQQMLRDSKRRQWSVVIVYKLDRFARNKYESVVNRKKLTDNGVELVSAMENIPDTPEGKLFLAVIEGFNEYFSEDLKQKVNRGLRESWLKGNATGGRDIFGWDLKDKKYHINEAEAEIVREIFRKYAQGYKAQTIADDLKEKNFRRKNGKFITHKFVYKVLHDKRYTGIVTHKGEDYDKVFPAIISKELWTQVNAINEENKNAPGRKKEIFDYILSGKLICGKCKHRMVGESGTSKTGEIHYYYSCLSKRRKQEDCDCKAVKKQILEDYVIQATVAMLRRNSIITQIAETVVKVHEKMMQDDSGLQILLQKRDDAKKAADNIVKAIEQGIITDFTKDRLNGLQAELNELEIEINKAKQKSYAHLSVEEVEKFLLSKVFEDPDDIKVRKLLVNTFVREVIWYGDRMVITYNFQERFSTDRFSKSYVEDIERQVGECSRSASSFSLSSYKVTQSAPCLVDKNAVHCKNPEKR